MSGGDVRPVGRARALWRGSPRRELTMTLLLGAIGAGIIFLATRQTWAQVHTVLPRPLPDSRVSVTGAALVPSADALVVAGKLERNGTSGTRWPAAAEYHGQLPSSSKAAPAASSRRVAMPVPAPTSRMGPECARASVRHSGRSSW